MKEPPSDMDFNFDLNDKAFQCYLAGFFDARGFIGF